MFVQWCIKGVRGRLPHEDSATGIDDPEANAMVLNGQGCLHLSRLLLM
jgi:hypothetical protein